MREKILKLMIVLIAAAALCAGAYTAPVPPSQKPAQKTDEPKKQQDDPEDPEKEAMEQIEPGDYRSVEGLSVPEGTRISLLMREDSSEFADRFEEGAQQACDELNEALGYTGKEKVKVTCSAPARDQDVSGQGAILDEELNLYPDVMAVSLVDASSCEVQFDLAMENGLYIVGFDAVPSYDRVVTDVTTDNAAAAAEAADRLIDAMQAAGGEGPVMVFTHDATASNLKKREKAFLRRIGRDKTKRKTLVYHLTELDEKRVKIAEALSAQEDAQEVLPEDLTQEDIIRFLLEKHSDASGIFLADEQTAQTVLPILAGLQTDVRVAAFGDPEELSRHARAGQLLGVIEENPYGMGYATMVASIRAAAELDNVRKVNSGHRWVSMTE